MFRLECLFVGTPTCTSAHLDVGQLPLKQSSRCIKTYFMSLLCYKLCFFSPFIEKMFAQPVSPPRATSHVWSLMESESASLFTVNVRWTRRRSELGLFFKGSFVPSASASCLCRRSFKQLIGGLEDVGSKQSDSDEVKAK